MPTTAHGLTYFSRKEWGAKYSRGPKAPKKKDTVVAHHSWKPDIAATATLETEIKVVQSIEAYHIEALYSSTPIDQRRIGYEWLVFDSGRVFEGIGWGRVGAHAAGANTRGVGICFVVNGDIRLPSKAALDNTRNIIRAGILGGHLSADYVVRGHADYSSKSCPGKLFYPILQKEFAGLAPTRSSLPVLRIGAIGPEVKILQQLLRDVDADGWFGVKTEAAVKKFQQAQGLVVDGIVGKRTWAALGANN